MYLHELYRIIRKAGSDQGNERRKADPEGLQHFTPVTTVVSENRLYIVFVNLRIEIANRRGGEMVLVSNTDQLLVTGAYLRVRDDGRKK